MENSTLISLISGIFGLIGIVLAALVGLRQTKITARSADQQTNISGVNSAIAGLDTLAKQHTAELQRVNIAHADYVAKCDVDRINFATQIGQQAGQIEVLKSIPLVNIDTTLQEISKFNKSLAKTNSEILKTLKTSAAILVKDNADKADAVLEVKTDLKEDDKMLARKVKNGE